MVGSLWVHTLGPFTSFLSTTPISTFLARLESVAKLTQRVSYMLSYLLIITGLIVFAVAEKNMDSSCVKAILGLDGRKEVLTKVRSKFLPSGFKCGPVKLSKLALAKWHEGEAPGKRQVTVPLHGKLHDEVPEPSPFSY